MLIFDSGLNMHDHAVKRQLLLVARALFTSLTNYFWSHAHAHCKLRVAEIYKRRAAPLPAGPLRVFVTWTDPVN